MSSFFSKANVKPTLVHSLYLPTLPPESKCALPNGLLATYTHSEPIKSKTHNIPSYQGTFRFIFNGELIHQHTLPSAYTPFSNLFHAWIIYLSNGKIIYGASAGF